MRLRIHRGTKEIGGTCIEVEAQSKRLALDVGLPLDAPDDEGARESLLPAVPGFRERDDSLLGRADLASSPRPLRLGASTSARRFRSTSAKTRTTSSRLRAATFRTGTPSPIPRFIAHRQAGGDRAVPHHTVSRRPQRVRRLCAADRGRRQAGVLLRRLPWTRAQGKACSSRWWRHPPADIDVSADGGNDHRAYRRRTKDSPPRDDLERDFVQAFQETKGLALRLDLVAEHRPLGNDLPRRQAHRPPAPGRPLHRRSAWRRRATRRHPPNRLGQDVRLYVPHRQRVYIKQNQLFEDLRRHKPNRVFPEDLSDLGQ